MITTPWAQSQQNSQGLPYLYLSNCMSLEEGISDHLVLIKTQSFTALSSKRYWREKKKKNLPPWRSNGGRVKHFVFWIDRNRLKRSRKMACRSMLGSMVLLERSRPLPFNRASGSCNFRTTIRARDFQSAKRAICCSYNETPSSSFSQDDQGPPQEAVLKAISGELLIRIAKTLPFIFMWCTENIGPKEREGFLFYICNMKILAAISLALVFSDFYPFK